MMPIETMDPAEVVVPEEGAEAMDTPGQEEKEVFLVSLVRTAQVRTK